MKSGQIIVSLILFISLLIIGCSKEELEKDLLSPPRGLSGYSSDILGFENYLQWQNASANNSNHTQGNYSIEVNVNGWTEVISPLISSLGQASDVLSIDIMLPYAVSWGDVRIVVKIPSLNEWYNEIGSNSLVGLQPGVFHSLVFSIPEVLQYKLSSTYTDLTFSVIINAPQGKYLFDNLNLGLYDDTDFATDSEVDTSTLDDSTSGESDEDTHTGENGGTDEGIVLSGAVRLPRGLHPSDVVLGADSYLKINDRVEIDPLYAYTTSNGYNGLNIGVDAFVGNVISRGDAIVRERAIINGDLICGSNIIGQSQYSVFGILEENADVNPVNEIVLNMGFPWSMGYDVILFPDMIHSLLPGTYKDVKVNSRAQIFLSTGVYQFRSFNLEPESKIVIDDAAGPVAVLISDDFFFRGEVVNTSDGFPQWMIGYSGKKMITFERRFRGVVIAPSGKINLEAVNAPGHEGGFYGKEIEIFRDAKVSSAEFSGWVHFCGDVLSGACETGCPVDYFYEAGACINSKYVDCIDVSPANAVSEILPVEITYSSSTGWVNQPIVNGAVKPNMC